MWLLWLLSAFCGGCRERSCPGFPSVTKTSASPGRNAAGRGPWGRGRLGTVANTPVATARRLASGADRSSYTAAEASSPSRRQTRLRPEASRGQGCGLRLSLPAAQPRGSSPPVLPFPFRRDAVPRTTPPESSHPVCFAGNPTRTPRPPTPGHGGAYNGGAVKPCFLNARLRWRRSDTETPQHAQHS